MYTSVYTGSQNNKSKLLSVKSLILSEIMVLSFIPKYKETELSFTENNTDYKKQYKIIIFYK